MNYLHFFLLCFSVLASPLTASAQDRIPNDASVERVTAEIEKLKARDQDLPIWNRYLDAREKAYAHFAKTVIPDVDEFQRLAENDVVYARSNKILELKRELKVLLKPQSEEALEQSQTLCEDRHRLLANQPVPPTPNLKTLGFDVLSFPKIDGSTSTQPLACLIACRYFDLDSQWRFELMSSRKKNSEAERLIRRLPNIHKPSEIEFWEPYWDDDIEYKLAEYSFSPLEKIKPQQRHAGIIENFLVGNESTHQAYLNIISGTSDFGLLARKPNSDELEFARKHNIELEVVPCARDAFVFIVAQDGPVANLSTDQIRSIYSGVSKRWDEVGGTRGTEISAYRRPKNSGSEELMVELVMKQTPLSANVSSDLVGSLMSSVFLYLAGNNSGIAYSVRYYEHYMAGNVRTRTIKVNGSDPNPENISNGTYPYIANVYAVIRRDTNPDNGPRKLLTWLLSAEGQAVVKQSGYVPLN